jgi:hypothetical protein
MPCSPLKNRVGQLPESSFSTKCHDPENRATISQPSASRRLVMRMVAVFVGLSSLTSFAGVPDQVDFDAHVKPILSDRCFKCHGPDDSSREADVRFDSKAAAFAVLDDEEGTYLIKPGHPDSSIAYRRITSRDPDERMPPPDSKLKLSRDEIETIRKWIEQGAEWKNHWSFEPRREIPIPNVEDESWPTNEIDRFILSKIESTRGHWAGLKPNAMAAKETLLRRVTFDLTGLPPTLSELDDFLGDKSPNAYEHAVDRLLASERYGEHLTAGWLDAARYSDTYGYQVDRDRHVWPWRDWVVRAFNSNMSYNRFITEQIAGDLLPGATDDQILATAFNRLHPQKVEGGSVPEEFRTEYVADRAQTFATAFLGLTLECCRCHDHKYDPVTQREYYQLFAFFNTIDEAGLYSYFTPAVPTPTLSLSDRSVQVQLEQMQQNVADAENNLSSITASAAETQAWIAEMAKQNDLAALIPGRVAHLDFENPSGPNRKVAGKVGNGVELTGDDGIGTGVGNFKRFEPFSVAFWMKTPDIKSRAVVFHRSRAWTDAGSRGYQLLIEDGRLSASLIHFWPGNAIRVRTSKPVATGKWLHVAMTYDGSGKAAGLQIYVNGSQPPTDVVRDNLYRHITGGGGNHITIGQRFRDLGFKNGQVDEFSVYNRCLNDIEVAHLHAGETLKPSIIGHRAGQLAKQAQYRDWYLANGNAAFKQASEELKAARKAVAEHQDQLTEIMVMREMVQPRTTYLLKRGAYDAPGDEVVANTPAALPPFPESAERNRLGLAKWLTDPSHPLTARVAVNRFWQQCFGDGLVRTPEDFGTQGDRPTHPKLLDWLANDFVNNGWDVKRLLKQIVMSSTYRQSSVFTKELSARDPENRLLARAPRFRLSAEMLRDNALSVAGLLKNKIGGPPARPYEVEVSFKPAKRDSGDGLYRRSLYTYWKRTGPAPVMMSLDASKRDVCRVKRERTSSPLQAFVLLNGPQFVEAARMLSQRLLKQHGEQTDAALTELFRTLTSRNPHVDEIVVLRRLLDQQLKHFGEKPELADEYLNTGDAKPDASIPAIRLAAFCVVANTLMNFDESVMKR